MVRLQRINKLQKRKSSKPRKHTQYTQHSLSTLTGYVSDSEIVIISVVYFKGWQCCSVVEHSIMRVAYKEVHTTGLNTGGAD